ncbi:MAG: hypothetical protein NXI01_09795 [Gammaproteobacteria bacterium]|nr:hypothetical protein [Gammaproteobacteria bacterium]
MIIRVLILFGILLASAYVGTWLRYEPGYVLVSFNHWSIESTFWVAVVAVFVFALALHLVLSILKSILRLSKPSPKQNNYDWLDASAKPILSNADVHKLKQQTHLQSLQECIEHHNHSELTQLLAHLPKNMKKDPEVILLHARSLLRNQEHKRAEEVLRKALKTRLDDSLLKLYGQVSPDYARIPVIESLLKKNPKSAALHACLGQLLVAKKLWGTAKTHLEKSIELQPSPEAYCALGILLEALEDPDAANVAYKDGLHCGLDHSSESP